MSTRKPFECQTWPQCPHECLREGEAIGLAQDIADGAALRLLREALPNQRDWYFSVDSPLDGFAWEVTVESSYGGTSAYTGTGPTIAAAADACRAALTEVAK